MSLIYNHYLRLPEKNIISFHAVTEQCLIKHHNFRGFGRLAGFYKETVFIVLAVLFLAVQRINHQFGIRIKRDILIIFGHESAKIGYLSHFTGIDKPTDKILKLFHFLLLFLIQFGVMITGSGVIIKHIYLFAE